MAAFAGKAGKSMKMQENSGDYGLLSFKIYSDFFDGAARLSSYPQTLEAVGKERMVSCCVLAFYDGAAASGV